MDFATLHKQRLYIMIASLVGVISMFLLWINIPFFGSTNGLHDSGILILFAFIGAGVLAYLGDQKKPLPKTNWLGVLGCGAGILLFWLINFFDMPKGFSKVIGMGFWICLLAAAGVLASAYIFRDPNQNLGDSLKDMKKTVENKLDNDPNT
jgi:hypothetical protein